ncbi:hypothetical protein T4A_3327 [Trichinella pseudospiralis]|uniref:Uncharacterized protein n=1 Tax=Trichinella pseudospiralis TaxID=6337 RepID=A0A0V1E3F9_TRIPS|nr:hypothetical protein T4A_3327 [Trichinella pseudospiralis]
MRLICHRSGALSQNPGLKHNRAKDLPFAQRGYQSNTQAAIFTYIELPILIYEVQHTYVSVFMFTNYGLLEAVIRTTRDD